MKARNDRLFYKTKYFLEGIWEIFTKDGIIN